MLALPGQRATAHRSDGHRSRLARREQREGTLAQLFRFRLCESAHGALREEALCYRKLSALRDKVVATVSCGPQSIAESVAP